MNLLHVWASRWWILVKNLWCQHTFLMINETMDLNVMSWCEMITLLIFSLLNIIVLPVDHTHAHGIKLALCGAKFGFEPRIQTIHT